LHYPAGSRSDQLRADGYWCAQQIWTTQQAWTKGKNKGKRTMILNNRLIPRIAVFLASAVIMTASAHADVILTLSGTPDAPTLTATVDNSDSFTATAAGGVLDFFLGPNTFDIGYVQNGPLGSINPDQIRAPGDGSYLNFVRLSQGDFSVFTLDASHPYTTSGETFGSDVSSLAVLNGVTSTMSVVNGSGPTTAVTFNYDIDASSSVPEPSTFLMIFMAAVPGLGVVIRKRRARQDAAHY
jgi:PEP-CTERM motif-containing protein